MIGKIRRGLQLTRSALAERVTGAFGGSSLEGEASMEDLEEVLLAADVGLGTVSLLLDNLPRKARSGGDALKEALAARMKALWPEAPPPEGPPPKPWVVLVVGVNGVGKTTTIGKLAAIRTSAGQRGILAAGDTFRAAAMEQLAAWSGRAGTELVRQQAGADPAAVAFDAVRSAVAKGKDFVYIDTAGRLQVKHNLMEELAKIRRVVGKALPGAPHQVSLVLDATTGQNGLSQAKIFMEKVAVSDLILTKLDGTAKGGIALSIASELRLPIRYVGVGEAVEDLVPFDADEYVEGLLA